MRIGVVHTTVARRLRRLNELGWLAVENRKVQYGRTGRRYFPWIPMERLGTPIRSGNGASRRTNVGCADYDGQDCSRYEALELEDGALDTNIGARGRRIGAPSTLLNLKQTLTEKSAPSPAPAYASSVAQADEQRRLRARVWTLLRSGRTDAEILAELDGKVSPEQVEEWRQLRDLMPMLPR